MNGKKLTLFLTALVLTGVPASRSLPSWFPASVDGVREAGPVRTAFFPASGAGYGTPPPFDSSHYSLTVGSHFAYFPQVNMAESPLSRDPAVTGAAPPDPVDGPTPRGAARGLDPSAVSESSPVDAMAEEQATPDREAIRKKLRPLVWTMLKMHAARR